MIIVTGGTGFIGSNIIKILNENGITNILVVDNLKNGKKFRNLVDLNITNYMDKKDFLVQIMKGKKFYDIKAVFHEGACTSTMEWDGQYMMNNNYQYSKELLDFCLKHNIPFLYASSAAVYGNHTSNFIESRKYERPLNIYGYSKFLFDEYVRKVLPKATSQIVGFRYFSVYGQRENHKGEMASIIFHMNTRLKNGENPKLFIGSEKFKRDFIFVEDVASANLWFLKSGISGIFNLGTGRAESFQTVASSILTFYKKGNIDYIPFPETLKNSYQMFTQANLTRLRAIGYNKPFKTLIEGIREYMTQLNCDT